MSKMQIADAWLVFDDKGSCIPVKGISPAEALFLNKVRKRHKDDSEQKIQHISNVKEVERSNVQEKERLLSKYGERDAKDGSLMLEKIIPGESPTVPMTFKDAGFEVTNTSPKENPKKLHYPDITSKESVADFEAARKSEVLSDDIQALKSLAEGQQKQIDQLITLLGQKK